MGIKQQERDLRRALVRGSIKHLLFYFFVLHVGGITTSTGTAG
jgi:hypothetical protein